MSDIYMAIIDGTGEADDGQYAKSMKHSFCRQLMKHLGDKHAHYTRGPSTFGKETQDCARKAFHWLWQRRKLGRLMLAGYSRGGSAAIMAAEMLQHHRVEVDSLFLFDAVARHDFGGGQVIPANVRYSRHARRDQDIFFVLKYEGTFSDFSKKSGDLASTFLSASNPTRPFFGNTGLSWAGNGNHRLAVPFRGSHGALGGVGWSFVEEDIGCQAEVARWMNRRLFARGVGTPLVPVRPAGPKTVPAGWPSHLLKLPGAMLDAVLLGHHALFNLSRSGKVEK